MEAINIGVLITWTQIVAGAIFTVLVFVQVLKLKKDIAPLRLLAYCSFGIVLAGIASGKYYAHVAPKYLAKIEATKPDEAVSGYTEALRYSPDSGELLFGRGHAKFYLYDFPGAIRDFTAALELSPSNPKYLANRALAYIQVHYVAAAERDIRIASEANEQTPELQVAQAIVSVTKNQYSEAVDKLNAALASKDFDPETRCIALIARGLSIGSLTKDTTKGIEDFKAAVSTCNEPKNRALAFGNLAMQYAHMNRGDLALQAWKKAEEADPADAGTFYTRAMWFGLHGQFDRELEDLNKYLDLKPNDPNVYLRRANIFDRMNETKRALDDRQKAKELVATGRARPFSSWPFESAGQYPLLMPTDPQSPTRDP